MGAPCNRFGCADVLWDCRMADAATGGLRVSARGPQRKMPSFGLCRRGRQRPARDEVYTLHIGDASNSAARRSNWWTGASTMEECRKVAGRGKIQWPAVKQLSPPGSGKSFL